MRKKKEKFMQIIIAKKTSDVPETLFPSCVCDEADTNRSIQYFMRWNVTAAQSQFWVQASDVVPFFRIQFIIH